MAKIETKLTEKLGGTVAAPASPSTSKDVPLWLKVTGAVMALALTTGGVLGLVWTLAISPVVTRLAALETARVETLAALNAFKTETSSALVTLGSRIQAAEARAERFDTAFSTATRLRDQQQQGQSDRLRALELADQNGAERLAQLAQTIASILPRLEEILRRQERLENRLGSPGTRPGADEAPAVFAPSPSHI